MDELILGVSGHRPDKVGGYNDNPWRQKIIQAGRSVIEIARPKKVITGMALGWDQWVAEICLELEVSFIAAIPFEGQELKWPAESQKKYIELVSQADELVYVSPPGYHPYKMETRNRWVVDHSTKMLFLWNGTSGGTANCMKYTMKKKVPFIKLNPDELRP